jgi:CHAD domain-containing protein
MWSAAGRAPSDGDLHEWRKQTKYLWHQLQILEPISPSMIKKLADQAHQLSDQLGADHDLAVLRQRLSRARGRLPRTAIQTVSRMIDRRCEELQAKAMATGARVYDETPGRFVKRLEACWRAWRSE